MKRMVAVSVPSLTPDPEKLKVEGERPVVLPHLVATGSEFYRVYPQARPKTLK
jgi:hypothetical protein